MSVYLSLLVTAIYVGICIEQALRGNHPMAVAYAGWASANTALLFTIK